MQPVVFPCGIPAMPLSSALQYSLTENELSVDFSSLAPFTPVSAQLPLLQIPLSLDSNAQVIGDGFQMLAQTAGTFKHPIDIGRCPDNNASYRIYALDAPKRYYNYVVIGNADTFTLLGFTSCHRFAGYFEFLNGTMTAFIDGEHTDILQQCHCEGGALERLVVLTGSDINALYQQFSALLIKNHPQRAGVSQPAPIGWCSWYAYYAGVSAANIQQNVDEMQGALEDLEWVLLDDGYQAFMGDWLTPSDRFVGGIKSLIQDIKGKGKKPAIWMAPFIAQPESQLFKEHPEWFVKTAQGDLLKAEDITYGGWRCTPWYILDTSHPDVCAHLTHVVRTMREEWGVELFKLDANYWGTLKGVRHQVAMTGVQAYRLGMEAISDGAGEAWLLGCNAPMWPSLGLVDAMRVSDDVERQPHRFSQIAKETFLRSWQHQRLWQIDPDCATFISIEGQGTSADNYQFHRDVLLACGGLLLSGDPLYHLDDFARHSLTRLIARQHRQQAAAVFENLSYRHATIDLDMNAGIHTGAKLKETVHIVFNFHGDAAREVILTSSVDGQWVDYWTGEPAAVHDKGKCLVSLSEGLSSRAVVFKPRVI
ncbi:glycoside hydrolase family 36 protein [Photobacterium chitinilyticum]|uniref:Glycosyl hydrolase n=1 Tax=Photobacterium chitinilyticum TaxID=2485123 RepID=A0A3S3UG48_9GAMM|nr:alpha-galactosidase [Photobacterium chitinilyticum]RWX53136.1 glycosyl hydrolase [Photobacterium chitinilyticum]